MMESNSIIISTEEITPELLAEAAALYAAEVFKTKIWSWQFKTRFGETPKAVVARNYGKLVGFNATMPIRISLNNAIVIPAIWSCDFIVDKSLRGQGIGSHIKDEMLKHFDRPIMSLGISDSAYPLLLKKGWKSPQQLEIFQLVIRPASVKQYILKSLGILNKAIHFFKAKKNREDFFCSSSLALPDKNIIDSLLLLQAGSQSSATIYRDHEYLSWRYQEYPVLAYRFSVVSNSHNHAKALLIYRCSSEEHIEVCDILGAFDQPGVIAAIKNYLVGRYPMARLVTWSSSQVELKVSLLINGFVLKRYSTRFVVHDSQQQLESASWALSSGDSDGDFLRIAKETFSSDDKESLVFTEKNASNDLAVHRVHGSVVYRSNEGYEFSRVEVEDFYCAAKDWNALLEKSSANKLFLNWHWVYCWWQQWSDALKLCLNVYFIYYRGELVGILPLYTYKKGFFRYYQFMGNAWGLAPTVRSEYIGPIFHNVHALGLASAVSSFIKTFSHNSIFVVPDALTPDVFSLDRFIRRVDAGYYLKTTGSLREYENGLGKMTRLKAFNRRDYLLANYKAVTVREIGIEQIAVAGFFEMLNKFHLSRWGKPCFNENAVNFHTRFLLTCSNMRPLLSCMEIDGIVVSVSYNLVVDRRFYNIQSGYLEHFDKKISLGTLHMGWMIENCFNDSSIDEFDFLAGAGKTEDYKSHYRGQKVSYYTVQYFTSRLLCNLFILAKHIKGFSPFRWRQKKPVFGK